MRATYQDIVPDHRIVSSHDMLMNDCASRCRSPRSSFTPRARARAWSSPQGAFLDGQDTPAQREAGTRELDAS